MQARFQTVSRAEAEGRRKTEVEGRSLNFYSCADETAIFRSIKWALKLSGQFRRWNVLLFSSIPLSSGAASPSGRVTVFLTASPRGPCDRQKIAILRSPRYRLRITSNQRNCCEIRSGANTDVLSITRPLRISVFRNADYAHRRIIRS